MGDLEGLLRDPVIIFTLKVLQSQCSLRYTCVALSKFFGIVDIRSRVHVSNVVFLSIQSKFAKSRELFCGREHRHQPFIVSLIVLDLKQRGPLALPGHHDRI